MKSFVTLLALMALCACGFEPMHGRAYQERSISGDLAAIRVDTPTGILGELLRAEIEDAVNPEYHNVVPRYKIQIELIEQDIPLFVNIDGTANRGEIRYVSSYRLMRLADNTVVHTGVLRREGSYNSSQTADYAAYVSKEDAKKRAILELAQDYKLRLANLSARLAE
jgi:hypothetical protein